MYNNKLFRIVFFLLGFVLFLDGFILILYKKIHLGTILPLLIGLVFISTALWSQHIQQYLAQHLKLKKIWRLGWVLFTLWSVSLIGFFGYIHLKSQQNTAENNLQAIIVLGSGITQGKASPTLAKRLDQAGEIAKQQSQALIIVSGGLDFGEKKPEAEIMSQYLQEHMQIQASRILQENKSTSTDLNLKNSQAILKAHGLTLDSKIAIVTSDFHTLRAAAIARKQGYHNFITVGTETPLTTRYNAWLREYFAYISGWVLGEY
ncbi:YdcF family protein [Acinetobacter guillouiae]|uniref:YdcF family protein n=1 Tax=Acinetobacter guillouiae TaxID=106649 RepID=UPI000BBB78D6|nr:YdcF family protein [Acinetobacter guillouiae]